METSRKLFCTENTLADQQVVPIIKNDCYSCQDLTMELPGEIILRIFSLLNKRTLMKIAQVCSRWNEIVKDKSLWKVISLSPCSFELTDESFHTLTKTRLEYTQKLHLCNVRVTFGMLQSIHTNCISLKTLLFGRNCSMDEANFKNPGKKFKFSKEIETLDTRLASGNFDYLSTLSLPKKLKNLINLGVGPRSFQKSNLLEFLDKLPNLKYVDFTNCIDLDDDSIRHLSTNCRNIESLCLIGCRNITGSSFETLINHCVNIKTLLLRYLKIDDDILARPFWKNCVLEELDISACPSITPQGLYSFVGYLKTLKYLNMSYCGEGNAVNDAVLYEMSNSGLAGRLKMLDLRWSFHITPNALRAVLQKCKMLQHLGIYQSFRIKADDMSNLLNYLPSLKIMEFGSADPQELNYGSLVRNLVAFVKNIEVVSLINFKSTNTPEDYKSLQEFFKESKHLKRVNFCDCATSLVKLGRAAEANLSCEEQQNQGTIRRNIDITTKWECALPPPRNTIDNVISR